MQPYKAKKLPIEYTIDKELLRLVAEANRKYGEYKSMLNTLEFNSEFFLDSVLLNESYKSTRIEGTQISQEEMYYLKYMNQTDDNKEIQNLKRAIEYAYKQIVDGQIIDFELVNEMHRFILDSVRGLHKEPGKIRTIQNWLGPRGVGIEGATFIPPVPEEVQSLLENLYEYMNCNYEETFLVNIAISHAQFETIHAYRDGNGRVGRAMIPVQMAMLDEERPILYLSEILDLFKPSYQYNLKEYQRGNILGYIKFFMQCVIDQCRANIFRLKKINNIYKEDMKRIEEINGNSVYKIMPEIMKQVVFTKKEIQDATGISIKSASRIIDQLVDLNIIIKDDTVMKKGYRYQRIYEVFVDGNEY